MPTPDRPGLGPLLVLAFALFASFFGSKAQSAQLVHADPTGLCNGMVPCFTSVSAAVANAGPPPARVLIFPGTYAESLDLNTMGSALATALGDLVLLSVDASGQPAPGAVIDPAAPGGPGAGPAVHALAFPGALTLNGLVLRSPDDHALELPLGTAPVLLLHLDARSMAGGSGIVVLQAPASEAEVNLVDIVVDGSERNGVVVEAVHVVAVNITARNNGADGIRLGAREVAAERLTAEGNIEDGVNIGLVGASATYDLSDVTVRGNNAGLVVLAVDPTISSVGSIDGVAAAGNFGPGIVVSADALTATGLDATQNEAGMLLLLQDQLLASALSAIGNTGVGIAAGAAIVRIADAVATENRFGIAADGDVVVLENCSAANNGGVSGGLSEGAGFAVRAGLLEARNTTSTGNESGWRLDDSASLTASLLGERAALGWRGIPVGPQHLSIVRSRIETSHAASIEVRLFAGGRLTVACSDLVANGPGGLSLATNNAVDARSNFWGNAGGPLHPGNPGGSGDAITDGTNGGAGTIAFDPFLSASATDDDCPVLESPTVEVPAISGPALVVLALLLAAGALSTGLVARRLDSQRRKRWEAAP